MVSAAGVRAGVSASVTEVSAGLKPPATGVGMVYVPKPASGGHRCEKGSALVAAAGPHVPGASFWGSDCLYLPQSRCAWGVHVSFTSKPQAGPAGSQAALGPSRGIRCVEGPCWYLGRPVGVGHQWDKCANAACLLVSIKPDQPACRGDP